ncbi:MAG: 30S ribosomal protein S16 [Actinomycetota bacterium]
MLVKIRLRRMGKKKQPSYRIVVADSRAPRDGRYVESLGYYNPMTDPSTIELNGERALYWLGEGAQPTQQVEKLMKIKGVWEQFQGSKKK